MNQASLPKVSAEMENAVKKEDAWDRHIENTLAQLSQIYTDRLDPVEQRYDYNVFRPSWFADSIKQKKPFVTFLGPFSSGKSSFINYLLQGECLLTGPQPVTDKFTVVMYGDQPQKLPGRVLLADSRLPYRGLAQFGESFAESFAGFVVKHPILRSVSLIDTPGILEASGGIHSRRYNYVDVCRWFVEKSDIVFFLFDPTKLDAGPELRQIFAKALVNQESKIRIVMNKADSVRPQELMRVYGSLYWNLSNLVRSTEPPRLYVSSFWDKPYREGTDYALFSKEKADLLQELIVTVPMQSLDRRVTVMLQRATDVLVFMLICATYRSRLPAVFGKDKAKERFFVEYDTIVSDLAAHYHLSENNFPKREEIRSFLAKVDSKDFPDIEKLEKKGWITGLQNAINTELPRLLQPLKDHVLGDPRDRREAIQLQRSYIQARMPYRPPTTSADGPNNPNNVSKAPPVASLEPRSSGVAPSAAEPEHAIADPRAQRIFMSQDMDSLPPSQQLTPGTEQLQQVSTTQPGQLRQRQLSLNGAAAQTFTADQMQVVMQQMMNALQQQQQQQQKL